jgi:hypothetical protein
MNHSSDNSAAETHGRASLRAMPYILLILFLASCQKYPQEVRLALKEAGDNKQELIEVLDHCKKQGKKEFEAACFLIANMRYHQSAEFVERSEAHIAYFAKADSLYSTIFGGMDTESINDFASKAYDDWRKQRFEDYNNLPPIVRHNNKSSDLQTIQADFLIDNIVCAFDEWQHNPLLKNMDFDTFKEFVLPYRTTDESPMFKRSEIRALYQKELSKEGYSNPVLPIERYKVYVEKCRWLNYYAKPFEHTGIFDIQLPKFKMDCHNVANWTCNILRACGVPAVYEYTPQWVDRSRRHFWCASPDSMGIVQPFTPPENNLRDDWESEIKYAGKVYRKGFAANKRSPYFASGDYEYIPEELSSPLLTDQTSRYKQTVTLRLPFPYKTDNRLAYLCMFDGDGLNPVGWGRINKRAKEVIFEQVPIDMVFVPVYYEDEKEVPIGSPFMVGSEGEITAIPQPLTENHPQTTYAFRVIDGKLKSVKNKSKTPLPLRYLSIAPDGTFISDMTLLRKYPEKRTLQKLQQQLVGAFFVGSDQEKTNFDTLFILEKTPVPYLQEISWNHTAKYRYYRFFTHDKGPVNIAHMEFLGPYSNRHDCAKPTPLPVLSPQDTLTHEETLYKINGTPLRTGSKPEVAFDDDYETFVGSSGIGMDFNKPVLITHVRFIPRTANNAIVAGDTYQLLFHNGQIWEEHDIQEARYNYLEFHDVPSGTLYWLRDLSHGKEELPFFYVDGKQHFMNMHNSMYYVPL